MMRLFLAFIFCLTALPVAARCTGPSFLDRLTPQEHAQLDAAVAATPFAEGLLFSASRGDQHLTIAGTIHIYDPALDHIAATLAPAIRDADILLVEASPEDAAALEAHLAANPDMMFLTDGPTLPELLDEATWDQLAEAARARNIPPFMAAKMQPWFLSISMALPPCAMADMLAGQQGLDFMLMAEAESAGVAIRSLEPWSLVIDLMREDPLEDQIAALEVGLMPVDIQNELFVAMMGEYLAGRTAEVWEASRIAINYVPGLDPATGLALFDELEQKLLADRNRDWMPVIADAIAGQDRAVIAVGAAHLPGEVGILRLLEADGWQITAID